MDADEEGKSERGEEKGVSIEDCCVHFEIFGVPVGSNKRNTTQKKIRVDPPYRASIERI